MAENQATSDRRSSGPSGTRARRTRLTGLLAAVGAVFVVALAAVAPIGSPITPAGAAGTPSDGIVCTSNSDGHGSSNFLLTATDGYISMPDGNSVYMWSYAYNNQAFQYPGPVLCVTEGETVNITLVNHLTVATSLQFPSIEGVTADGNPAAPQFDGSGTLVSLTNEVDSGGSVSYSFTASSPGSFLYESGSDPELQVQMGLFGMIVVRPVQPAGGGAQAWAYDHVTPADVLAGQDAEQVLEPGSIYNRNNEYVLMLSELDPDLHVSVEQGRVSNSDEVTAPYAARYFLINGRAFPDTIAPNHAAWLPSQPYGGLARVQPYDAGANPLPALLRYVSVGQDTYPFHPHSNHEKVIGMDGTYLSDGAADLSMDRFAIVVNPGQTQDALFSWTNVEDYQGPADLSVAPPNGANLTEGDFWSGTPFLGQTDQLNPGINAKGTECGEYYHVAHNHNLSQATNYGASFGGMLTLIRVDPPGGCG